MARGRVSDTMDWRSDDSVRLLDRFLESHLPLIDREMRSVIQEHDQDLGELANILRYHLGWMDAALTPCAAPSGKRLRPVLCLLSCEGAGGIAEMALPAASAVELLHNFTLIHDDIEDGDERRRGRPTLWAIWGEAQGINAGDTLFALSQLALLRLKESGGGGEIVAQAVRMLNETCVRLTRGQYLDIDFESRQAVSVEEYLSMIEAKTAALIGCACALGSLIGGADLKTQRRLRAFGHHSGLAFQMQDDVLGIWGDPQITGKPVGSDIVRRKKTLPLVHGLERSAELRSLLARDSLGAADLERASSLLEETGSRDYVELVAREHYDQAMEALDRAALTASATTALRELAEQLVRRER